MATQQLTIGHAATLRSPVAAVQQLINRGDRCGRISVCTQCQHSYLTTPSGRSSRNKVQVSHLPQQQFRALHKGKFLKGYPRRTAYRLVAATQPWSTRPAAPTTISRPPTARWSRIQPRGLQPYSQTQRITESCLHVALKLIFIVKLFGRYYSTAEFCLNRYSRSELVEVY